jgi:hypothetical protein
MTHQRIDDELAQTGSGAAIDHGAIEQGIADALGEFERGLDRNDVAHHGRGEHLTVVVHRRVAPAQQPWTAQVPLVHAPGQREAVHDTMRAMLKGTSQILALAFVVLGLVATTARADDLSDAKAFIAKQVELIKKSDVAGLKAGFTPRLQDRITEANVKKAQGQAASITIDELVASVAPGKDTLKIKMKNGRTLTTLVKVDGKWLADTVWFK